MTDEELRFKCLRVSENVNSSDASMAIIIADARRLYEFLKPEPLISPAHRFIARFDEEAACLWDATAYPGTPTISNPEGYDYGGYKA